LAPLLNATNNEPMIAKVSSSVAIHVSQKMCQKTSHIKSAIPQIPLSLINLKSHLSSTYVFYQKTS
jgi:hypothetical protein